MGLWVIIDQIRSFMSASPQKADIKADIRDVSFVPIGDIQVWKARNVRFDPQLTSPFLTSGIFVDGDGLK